MGSLQAQVRELCSASIQVIWELRNRTPHENRHVIKVAKPKIVIVAFMCALTLESRTQGQSSGPARSRFRRLQYFTSTMSLSFHVPSKAGSCGP